MRLSVKLALAFLVVGLTAVGFIALLASRSTEQELRTFASSQYRASISAQLSDYFRERGAWQGVETALPLPSWHPPEMPRPQERWGPQVGLADGNGVIVVAGAGHPVGETLSSTQLDEATAIEIDGQIVGWLLAGPLEPRENPAGAIFLERTRLTLAAGVLGAAIASLLLGILLTRAITRPIREMTVATQAIAQGDLAQRVSVGSRDELGALALSFNQMTEQLARAQEVRRRMTADIAHELRTPISVIIGHVEAMNDGVLPGTAETLDVIREEAHRLARLVEDLRTLSRADAGEIALVCSQVDPESLLRRVCAAYRPFMLEKDISLELEIDAETPQVSVDPDRIVQVIDNLLGNAVRFTPKGGRIRVRCLPDGERLVIRVTDSGPGIAAQNLPHVFDRFYRADASRQRETGGSGLGLAIAKAIVELHAGTITAESQPGQGTTFTVSLPLVLQPQDGGTASAGQ